MHIDRCVFRVYVSNSRSPELELIGPIYTCVLERRIRRFDAARIFTLFGIIELTHTCLRIHVVVHRTENASYFFGDNKKKLYAMIAEAWNRELGVCWNLRNSSSLEV